MTCRECLHWDKCFKKNGTRYYGEDSACDNVEKLCEWYIQKDETVTNCQQLQWIPVAERLPEINEYTAKSDDGRDYYVRLLIAYKTDIVEYEIGYYDGYKWMSEMPIKIIKDVVAWKAFDPLPQPPKEGE